jgi:hypothetical protein
MSSETPEHLVCEIKRTFKYSYGIFAVEKKDMDKKTYCVHANILNMPEAIAFKEACDADNSDRDHYILVNYFEEKSKE